MHLKADFFHLRENPIQNSPRIGYENFNFNTLHILKCHFLQTTMETILEQQRRRHEERERLTDAMSKEMLHKKGTHREVINSDHRLKMLLDQYQDSSRNVYELYEDKDGQRKEEVISMGAKKSGERFRNVPRTFPQL